jgi:hypothetical protein
MSHLRLCSILLFAVTVCPGILKGQAQTEEPKVLASHSSEADDEDHAGKRARWFSQGREARRGQSAAELRRRAFAAKLQMRAANAASQPSNAPPGKGTWFPLGPVPLASDATGSGLQDYRQVSGRATAVAIDPADPTGNTVFIGGAQSGVWKSTNAADPVANNVTWSPLTDSAPTLATGAIAIQPGNADPNKTVVIVATGEANDSGDSYFGAGMLRSADGGLSWTNIPNASNGSSTVSFSGMGGTRMAFGTASGQTNTVVAAMATSAEAYLDGAYTSATVRGLYTSADAGLTWSYDPLVDPGGQTTPASATSVVYNAGAGLFFAAVRYHGFYSSPDGVNWTRLANQPGAAGALSIANCPPTSSDSCPMYRAEISVVPGRNEMYTWFVGVNFSNRTLIDQGIWTSTDGGAHWTQVSDAGVSSCGDPAGCGISQGTYNLELLAVPNGSATDLYAGAINVYKCSISSANPTCSSSPFINLTHVYGCPVLSELAHVHPDQHAMAYILPGTGTDLMYFANDGGIYRALDGYTGLTTGSCSGSNHFDDLNQNLGPMTQFVAFSQHPTDANTLLGGTQDNGSPASSAATTSASWTNVLGGDGGYNAIDPNISTNWFASNPDSGNGGLQIYLCPSGILCNDNSFNAVVTSASVGGDDGPFYPFYTLDAQSTTAMLVGTCRLWRGPRQGGTFTVLSPNFDTFGAGTCTGNEANTVRSIAAGGPADANGSQVIYVTTNGLGPNNNVVSGHVWVTTQASNGPASFSRITGPINPNNYSISSAAIYNSDASGLTAFVSVMGFTGTTGHVWKTTDAASWADFSGTGSNALPDAPVNVLLLDSATHTLYAGTDVGVFQSSAVSAGWTEVGPVAGGSGFLPNVAVTGLALFDSGGEKLLRAATYGRGIWQFNIFATPNFQLAVPNATQTIFAGQVATFPATLTAYNGYNDLVALTCRGGSTAPPTTCAAAPSPVTPTISGATTALTASGAAGDYSFNLHAAGTDSNQTIHDSPITLHVVSFGITAPSPNSIIVPRGTTSAPATFQATAAGSFNQPVTVTCQLPNELSGSSCDLTPQSPVTPTANAPVNMTATVTVPASTAAGTYTATLQATSPGAPATVSVTFSVVVTTNPDFVFSEPTPFPTIKLGSAGTTGPITITAQDGFSGVVTVDCAKTFGTNSCSVSPNAVSQFPTTVNLTINGSSFSPGQYQLAVVGTSGAVTHNFLVPFTVSGFTLRGPTSLPGTAGNPALANLVLTSYFYTGQVHVSCDASSLAAAQCSLSPGNPISLSPGGTANLTASVNVPNSAAAGTYNIQLQAVDSTGAPVSNLTVPLVITQDYTIGTISPPGATVTAGGQASYNFSVIPIGVYNGSITLNCTIAPVFLGTCTFQPASVIPGSNVTGVSAVMTVTTIASTASAQPGGGTSRLFYGMWLFVPAFVLFGIRQGAGQKCQRMTLLTMLIWVGFTTLSCGGSGSTGGRHQGTNPGVYTVTVTGSPRSVIQPNGSATGLTVQ